MKGQVEKVGSKQFWRIAILNGDPSLPTLKLWYYLMDTGCCQLDMSFELTSQGQRWIYTLFLIIAPFLQLVLDIMSWLSCNGKPHDRRNLAYTGIQTMPQPTPALYSDWSHLPCGQMVCGCLWCFHFPTHDLSSPWGLSLMIILLWHF